MKIMRKIIEIDEELCTGCGDCVAGCPYGMIEQYGSGTAYKCDLCGGNPACVAECHFGALVFKEPDAVLRRLRDSGATVPVLILTARDATEDRIAGLDAGADDYLIKPFDLAELKARLRALLRRSQRGESTPQVLQIGSLTLDVARRELRVDGKPVELTPSEFELLRVLMQSPGYAFTRDELLEKALGYAYEGMGRTLDSHIKNLRRKLEPHPTRPLYVLTVRGVGYRLNPETENA